MLRIALPVATIISLFFVPWALLFAWLAPLPDNVQEQVDDAIGHGFDGIIVYVDEAGTPPGSLRLAGMIGTMGYPPPPVG